MPSNKIPRVNAGEPRYLPTRTRWVARIAQFRRSTSDNFLATVAADLAFPAAVADLVVIARSRTHP